MDGTLVDNMAYHQQSWIDFFAFHQINMSYETFDSKYHKGSLIDLKYCLAIKKRVDSIKPTKENIKTIAFLEILEGKIG